MSSIVVFLARLPFCTLSLSLSHSFIRPRRNLHVRLVAYHHYHHLFNNNKKICSAKEIEDVALEKSIEKENTKSQCLFI